MNQLLLNSKQQCYDGCDAMSYTKHKVDCGVDKWCKETRPTCEKILECHELKSKLKVCLGVYKYK